MTYEEAGVLLDKLAEELPEDFYRDLNGGILLNPEAKPHPDAPGLYIMGEYCIRPVLGRYIVVYYGSFTRVHGGLPPEGWERELRRTLRHEFTHHVESLAGDKSLERRDKEDLERYWAELRGEN